jgi:hypothetical protein
MSFDTSAIKNPLVYFPQDLKEGRIRKQRQDAEVPIGIPTLDDSLQGTCDLKNEKLQHDRQL